MQYRDLQIASLLKTAEKQLARAGISTSHLDTEVLLAYILHVDRSWLHAYNDENITPQQREQFYTCIQRRSRREPLAYITGYKEFYGRSFVITNDVLIPRPETESLIEIALQKRALPLLAHGCRVIDVGCGSGCIGITLKLEQPTIDVTLCDISPRALAIAKKNAIRLHADVSFTRSNLLTSFIDRTPRLVDVIVANLPYVSHTWQTSPETAYEPRLALYARDGGLEYIDKLIYQSVRVLAPSGSLLLEADPTQHDHIIDIARLHHFTHLYTRGYALMFEQQASQSPSILCRHADT